MKLHIYRPSTLHMGDCAVCGHLADSTLHFPRPTILISTPGASPGPLWDRIARANPPDFRREWLGDWPIEPAAFPSLSDGEKSVKLPATKADKSTKTTP